ncbi:unnamed protein product [Linum trigynum]|uniref:Uncharacterized protein n=1 Tax=Linum trigynum TaxID=586398 RepID=A0AAV2FV72_9ROSI
MLCFGAPAGRHRLGIGGEEERLSAGAQGEGQAEAVGAVAVRWVEGRAAEELMMIDGGGGWVVLNLVMIVGIGEHDGFVGRNLGGVGIWVSGESEVVWIHDHGFDEWAIRSGRGREDAMRDNQTTVGFMCLKSGGD